MNQKQKARWESTRAKGKWQYVLALGLAWGIGMTVFTPLISYYLFSQEFEIWTLWIRAPAFLIGGFVWALIMWNLAEDRYRDADKME